MSDAGILRHHPIPRVEEIYGYVLRSIRDLQKRGLKVQRAHLDPCNPVDATIYVCSFALVWNEQIGWRCGEPESGEPGERTHLANSIELGGSVLLRPELLADFVASNSVGEPIRPRLISARDGLYEGARQYC
jgi:hypothetical protein